MTGGDAPTGDPEFAPRLGELEDLDAFDWKLSVDDPVAIVARWGLVFAAILVSAWAAAAAAAICLDATTGTTDGLEMIVVPFSALIVAATHHMILRFGRSGRGRWGRILEHAARVLPSVDGRVRAKFELLPAVRVVHGRPCRVVFAPLRLLVVTEARAPVAAAVMAAWFALPLLVHVAGTEADIGLRDLFKYGGIALVAYPTAWSCLGTRLRVFEIPNDAVSSVRRVGRRGDVVLTCAVFGVPDRWLFHARRSDAESLRAELRARFEIESDTAGPTPVPPAQFRTAPGVDPVAPGMAAPVSKAGTRGRDHEAARAEAESAAAGAPPLDEVADLDAWMNARQDIPVDAAGRPVNPLAADNWIAAGLAAGAVLFAFVGPSLMGWPVSASLLLLGLAPVLVVEARRSVVNRRVGFPGRLAALVKRVSLRADACEAGVRLVGGWRRSGLLWVGGPTGAWVFGGRSFGLVTRALGIGRAAALVSWIAVLVVAAAILGLDTAVDGILQILLVVYALATIPTFARKEVGLRFDVAELDEARFVPEGVLLMFRDSAVPRTAELLYPEDAARRDACIQVLCARLLPALQEHGVRSRTWSPLGGEVEIGRDWIAAAPERLRALIAGQDVSESSVESLLAAAQGRYQEQSS